MSDGAHLVVVEDEPGISLPLTDRLRREGYRVERAEDGVRGLELARADGVDLVLLDLMLPRLNGSDVLRSLRESGNEVPVICLTARTAEDDRVGHLVAGADDYVTKPFSMDELVARVRAVLKRTVRTGRAAPAADAAPAVVEMDGVRIDLDGHTVERGGVREKLSSLESAILRCLVERRGRATSRTQILRSVWGPYAAVTDRTVDFHVKNLRRKLEPDPTTPRLLLTDHGVGYRIA